MNKAPPRGFQTNPNIRKTMNSVEMTSETLTEIKSTLLERLKPHQSGDLRQTQIKMIKALMTTKTLSKEVEPFQTRLTLTKKKTMSFFL